MHDHDGHDHHHDLRSRSRRGLSIALLLSALYMVAELVGGLVTGSLALLADAGHMASDVAALALSLFAMWIASRPASSKRTYGHSRAEILAALAHGVTLVAVALLISVEAIERLMGEAPPIAGGTVMVIATGGLAINGIAAWILNRERKDNINVRGAWLHVLADALGSAGAITSGALIWAFDWRFADPAASLAISALVLWSSWHLLSEAVDVLMETAPSHLDVDEIRSSLVALPDVAGIHDLHVWTIGNGEISLSSHVVLGGAPAEPRPPPGDETGRILGQVQALLESRFGISHATIQIEAPDADDCSGACDEPELRQA